MKSTITKGDLSITVLHKGAELCSFKNKGIEYIWEADPKFWGKHAPILFPIVGTLKDDLYYHEDDTYKLSRHGFARDMEFDFVENTGDSLTFKLNSNSDTFVKYPFKFELIVTYILDTDLTVKYTVKNENDFDMPFSIGGHTAFALIPGSIYSLEFPNDESLEWFVLENGLITDNTDRIELNKHSLDITDKLFENDALVIKKMNSKKLILKQDGEEVLNIQFDEFPNMGLWKAQKANFLCIEPWFGYMDTDKNDSVLKNKEGIVILNSNSVFETSHKIRTTINHAYKSKI